jgi:hypothetical protein
MKLPDPFVYPAAPHIRKHAPAGYKNYQDYKPWLRDEFEFRCVYCLHREMWSRDRHAVFSVDHVIPLAEDPRLFAFMATSFTLASAATQPDRMCEPSTQPVRAWDHICVSRPMGL